MASSVLGAAIGAGVPLLASPYLARLNLTVPDAEARRWWRGRPASPAAVAVTGLIAAVLGGLGGYAADTLWAVPAFVLLAGVAAPLCVIDWVHHRLPNRLVFTLAAGAPLLALLPAAAEDRWADYGRAAGGAAAVFAVLFALAFAAPKAFGYGDVKLGGVLGGYLGWFGWFEVFYGIVGGFVLGSVVAVGLVVAGRARMSTAMAFGPFLVLGPLVVLALDLVPRV